jgi:hypothetical protein
MYSHPWSPSPSTTATAPPSKVLDDPPWDPVGETEAAGNLRRRVRELFRELPAVNPRPVVVVDAARDVEAVWNAVREAVERAFQ